MMVVEAGGGEGKDEVNQVGRLIRSGEGLNLREERKKSSKERGVGRNERRAQLCSNRYSYLLMVNFPLCPI